MKLDANKKKYIKWGFLALIVFLILKYFKNAKPAPTTPTKKGGGLTNLPTFEFEEKPAAEDSLGTYKYLTKKEMEVVERNRKREGAYGFKPKEGEFNGSVRHLFCKAGNDYSLYSQNDYCIKEMHALFYGLDLNINGKSPYELHEVGILAKLRNADGKKRLMWEDKNKGYDGPPSLGQYLQKE